MVSNTPTPAAARRWLRSLSETFTPVNCCPWAASVLAPELHQKRRRQQRLETLDKGADRSSQITCARLHPQCNGVLRSKVQVLSDCNYIPYRISLQALLL